MCLATLNCFYNNSRINEKCPQKAYYTHYNLLVTNTPQIPPERVHIAPKKYNCNENNSKNSRKCKSKNLHVVFAATNKKNMKFSESHKSPWLCEAQQKAARSLGGWYLRLGTHQICIMLWELLFCVFGLQFWHVEYFCGPFLEIVSEQFKSKFLTTQWRPLSSKIFYAITGPLVSINQAKMQENCADVKKTISLWKYIYVTFA